MPSRRLLSARIARDGVRLAGAGVTIGGDSMPQSPVAARTARVGRKATTDTPADDTDALALAWEAMSERTFQRHVVEALRERHWLVFEIPDMRKTEAGWPDLFAIHDDWDMALALELKREKGGRLSVKQQRVLTILYRISGVYARVVRPSEWPGLLAWIDSVEREPSR